MYFASLYIIYKSVSEKLLTSCVDYEEQGRPFNFSFHSRDDFLDKLKKCQSSDSRDKSDHRYEITVTKHSVELAEYTTYTTDFGFETKYGNYINFKLNSDLQNDTAEDDDEEIKNYGDFDSWLESIEPVTERFHYNHIIAVTDPGMPCEVIGGFITQSNTAPDDIVPMVRKCLYDFDEHDGNCFNMVKTMSFPSNEIANLDYDDTNFIVKVMDFKTGEFSIYEDDDP